MEWIVVPLIALVAALLTLFSGFGLGTLLLPAFLLCFKEAGLAVAATAVVHLANNLFKAGLVGRHAVGRLVLHFGLPAALAAYAGAWTLDQLDLMATQYTYQLGSYACTTTPIGITMGMLMIVFALLELSPRGCALAFPPSAVMLGGVLSGFFGGLSGHQGALRTAFLARCGLTKEQLIGTGVACAILVDVIRLATYRYRFPENAGAAYGLIGLSMVAAFAGSFLGARWLGKTPLAAVHRAVAIGLLIIGSGTALGVW